MKRKNLLLTFLLAALILGGGAKVWAYDFSAVNEGQTIYYKISSGNAEVTFESTSYNSYSGVIVIPSTVTDPATSITYNVTSIGSYAFKGCTGLTSITIPSSITTMTTGAFSGCNNITTINYNATNISTNYGSGQFYDSRTTITTINIGENVTRLPEFIFRGITHAFSVTIPASVTNIGASAFRDCTGLTSVTLNEGLQRIGDYAFNGCTNASFTSITFPSTLTFIGNNAFENTKLTSVIIPANVTTLGSSVFKSCTNLTSLTLNEGLQTIGSSAFEGCTNIESALSIPSTVTSIAQKAFYNCNKIPSLSIGSGLSIISNQTFYSFKALTELVIPNNITSIGENAFYGCNNSSLTSVIIPQSVTTISNNAFSYCSNLNDIYMLSTTPATLGGKDAFKKTWNAYSTIHVMAGSSEAYSAATNWSDLTIDEYSALTIANLDLTNSASPLTIPSGVTITVTGTATNPTAANLVIADGGQLITNNPVNATLQKGINAASVWGEPGADAWYFIASPVDGYETSNVIINGITDTDLYSFDEESGYWFNGQGAEHPFTTLTRGQGYLYANSTGNDLSFLGTMPATNTTIEKPLSYAGSGSSKGFNLMGNPFTCNLTSDNVEIQDDETQTSITTYYIVENGTELATMNLSTDQIKPGRGFLIQADKKGQKLVFNPAAKRNETKVKPSFIRIEAGDEDFMDRAYVQIGSGNTLRKMTINDNVSHVYVMSEGKDYAAATIQEAQGEMPVNFKAAKNGQYTITVNPENVALDYLHLVDNLTGADIDLLATPSYTFNAKTTDYANRFRLLFAANGIEENGTSTSSANFAFISNGQLIVNGTGTLQIIDMTGRVVSTKSTEERISTNELTPGVYVVKLMGNETKTQKIVIE